MIELAISIFAAKNLEVNSGHLYVLIRRGFTMQISEKILEQNDRIINLIFCGQKKLISKLRPFVRVISKRLYYANLGKDFSTE